MFDPRIDATMTVELGERVMFELSSENLGLHAAWIEGPKDEQDYVDYRTSIVTHRTKKA